MSREDIRKKWKNKEFAEVTNKVNLHNNEKVITNANKNISQAQIQISNYQNKQTTNSTWERIMQNANQIINRTNKVANVNKSILNYTKSKNENEYSKYKNSKRDFINESKKAIEDTGRAFLGAVYGGVRGGIRALGQSEFLSQQRSDEYRKYNANQTKIQENNKNKTVEEKLEYNNKQLKNSKNIKGTLIQKLPSINESSSMQFFNKKEEEISKKISENAENANTKIGKYLAGQVTPSMGQSLVGTGLDIVAPGMGSAYRMLSYSGDYTQDGLNKGMNENQASMYGLTMAGVETVMDTIGDKLKGVAIGESKQANGLKELIKTGAKELGINSFFEGSGEALTEPLQEVVSKMYGGSEDFENIGQRMSEAFLAGAVSELLMTGGSLGYGSSVNVLNKMQNGEKVTVEEISDALKEINKKEEVNIEQVLKSNLEFAEKNLIQENQQEINEEINQKLEDIATELDRNEANKLIGFNNYKKINQIQNSGLTDFQKEKIYNMANKYKLSEKDIQYLIDNTKKGKYERNEQATIDNEQVLNNNQQVIPNNNKIAQNQISQQIESTVQNEEKIEYNNAENLQNYQNSAKKHNIDLNNDTVKAIFGTADRRGIKVSYDDTIFTNSNQNAIWRLNEDGSREIILNPNADTTKALQSIQVHELTHDMEGTKEYEALKDTVLNKMKTQEEYQESFDELSDMYSKVYDKNSENFNALVEQEAVADFLGENLGNQEFLNELVNSQPRSTIQKIYDWIVDKINKLTGYSKEKLYWQDVKTKFEKAFNSEFNNGNQNSKYSILTNSKNQKYVKADRQVITGNNSREWQKQTRNYINEKIRKGQDVNVITDSGDILTITKDTAGKAQFRNEIIRPDGTKTTMSNEELLTKLTAETHIDELAQVSTKTNKLPVPDTKNHKFAKDGFDYRRAYFEDFDGQYYRITISVGKNGSIDTIYNIGRLDNLSKKNRSKSSVTAQRPLSQKTNKEDLSSINSIPNSDTNVNNGNTTKYSMQEKENNTGKWQEFLQKHSINKGTKTTINQVKLPGMPIEEYQKVLDNAKFIPQQDKKNLLSYLDNINRNKTSLNEFKNTVNELNNEYKKLDDETLNTNLTYNTGRKEIYQKYLNSKNKYDVSSLKNAKDIIKANSQGKRTKSQWINIAKQIGTEIANKSNTEIEEIAYRTWQDERPSSKESLNRQGKKFVNFTSDEWIDTIYNSVKEQRAKFSIDTEESNLPSPKEVNLTKSKIVDEVYREEIGEGKTRKHYQSIFESDQIGKTGKKVAKELYKTDTYTPVSNLDTITQANENINRNGAEDTYIAFRNKLRTNEKITLQDIATGERLIQIYSQQGDYQKVNDLVQDVAILGTELGQQVQAFSLIKKASPEGQLQYLNKLLERTNLKENTNIQITDEMTQKILKSKNQEELEQNMSDVAIEIAEQLPITLRDKIRSWRYLSMLGNPKTHIKNLGANVFMNLTQNVKNKVAGGVEDVAGIFNKNLERTKTLKPANSEQRNFAKQDAEYMQDLIDNGGKYDVKNVIESNKKQFNNRVLNAISEFNSDMLDVEDKIFLKLAYKQAMQSYMSANNLKASDMQGKTLEKARQYSSIQAQEATFHQFNALANTLNSVENRGEFGGKVVEAILPFKKTPMNIAKEGLEYSPVGLAKSISYDLYQLTKKTNDCKRKLNEGKITQKQYIEETSKLATKAIDNFAKGFTGSSIVLLGYFLSQSGVLKAGNDGEDDEFKEALGEQEYAIKIGDNTYTLDWISPSAIPLFTGATIQQLRSGEQEVDKSLINSTLTGFAKAFEPMTDMSMLQGLTSAISSYEQGSNMFFDLGASMATSYAGQFVPTVLGQVARTIDPYERDASTTKKGIEGKIDKFIKQTANKLPGLSQKLPIKKDIWGNDKKRVDNVGQRLLENAILPYNRKELIADRTDNELLKVFEETGENILPSTPNKELTINKEKYRLTSEEYNEAKKTFGTTSKNILNDLVTSRNYVSLSSEGRAKAISDVYSYAKEQLKKDYADKIGEDLKTSKMYNTVTELQKQNGDVSAYFEFNGKLDDLDREKEDENLKTKEKIEYLSKMQTSDKTKRIIYEDSFGDKDKVYSALKFLTDDKVSINEYLNYKTTDLSADKEDDGTVNGKTVSGSAKKKLIKYIKNSEFTPVESLYLYGTKYKLNNSERNQLTNYLKSSGLTFEELKEIYLTLNGTVEMQDGTVKWK